MFFATAQRMAMISKATFKDYLAEGFFDEMIGEDGQPRAAARLLAREIESLAPGELEARQQTAERALIQAGITFNVYTERREPFQNQTVIYRRAVTFVHSLPIS